MDLTLKISKIQCQLSDVGNKEDWNRSVYDSTSQHNNHAEWAASTQEIVQKRTTGITLNAEDVEKQWSGTDAMWKWKLLKQ